MSRPAQTPELRVIVRRLPPKLPEAVFLQIIAPFRQDIAAFYYVVGDETLGENCFARAYLTFTTAQRMVLFAKSFDGHRFRNAEGVEHIAVVELAPLQHLQATGKPDKTVNTYEEDPDYKAFLAALDAPPVEASAPTEPKVSEVSDTPLLQDIRKNIATRKITPGWERRNRSRRGGGEGKERSEKRERKRPARDKRNRGEGKTTTWRPQEKIKGPEIDIVGSTQFPSLSEAASRLNTTSTPSTSNNSVPSTANSTSTVPPSTASIGADASVSAATSEAPRKVRIERAIYQPKILRNESNAKK